MDGFVWGNRNPQKGAVRIPWVFTEPVGLYGAETGTPSLTPSFMLLPSPLLSFTVDTDCPWKQKTEQQSQNSSSWDSRKSQSVRSSSGLFLSCTWSPSLETCSSS